MKIMMIMMIMKMNINFMMITIIIFMMITIINFMMMVIKGKDEMLNREDHFRKGIGREDLEKTSQIQHA